MNKWFGGGTIRGQRLTTALQWQERIASLTKSDH
jgi:hypothetical protein